MNSLKTTNGSQVRRRGLFVEQVGAACQTSIAAVLKFAGVMPLKNDFIRAGRFDLARAVERWGGLYELAAELGYDVSSPVFSSTVWQEHISNVAATTGLSGKQGLFELAAKTYRPKEVRGTSDDEGNVQSSKQKQKRAVAKMPTIRQEIDAW